MDKNTFIVNIRKIYRGTETWIFALLATLAVFLAGCDYSSLKSSRIVNLNPPQSTVHLIWQQDVIFLKSPGLGIPCPSASTGWQWMTAVTASTEPWNAHLFSGLKVRWAAWRSTWSPYAPTNNPAGVRLIWFRPDGVIHEIARIERGNTPATTGAYNDALNVTNEIQALIDMHEFISLGVQYHGDGVRKCATYGETIEIVWEAAP